jgi:hypothetical protein
VTNPNPGEMPMPANPFNRQIAFRFFFPRLNSGYTA